MKSPGAPLSDTFISPRDNCDKFGCQWCSRNSTGSPLSTEEQRCDYSDVCPNGQLLPSPPRSTTTIPTIIKRKSTTKSPPIAAIVVPIVVVIVLLAVAILGYVIWKKRSEKETRRRNSKNKNSDTIANKNVVDFPLSEHSSNGVMF